MAKEEEKSESSLNQNVIMQKIQQIEMRLNMLNQIVEARFEKIKEVLVGYLETAGNIALSTVRANLKNV